MLRLLLMGTPISNSAGESGKRRGGLSCMLNHETPLFGILRGSGSGCGDLLDVLIYSRGEVHLIETCHHRCGHRVQSDSSFHSTRVR